MPIVVAALATGRLVRSLGRYRFGRHEHLLRHLLGVLGAIAIGAALGVVTAELVDAPARDVFVTWTLPAAVVLLALHTVWWLMVRHWRAQGRLTPNIVIVGATRHAEDIVADALAERDINILGIFDDRLSRVPRDVSGVPVLGNVADLVGHRMTPFLDLIVVAVDPTAHDRVRELTQQLSVLPNDTALVVDDDGVGRHAAIRRLADAPLSPLDIVADPGRRSFAKRIQDVVMSATMLVLLSPLFGVIALAVRMDSPGPVFFRQRRHGFNNEEIVVWKFRTMRIESADAHAHQQVTANDARVTKVGRVLRATSLDELPQLLNVIQGSMSLVGPRPHAIGMRTGEDESAGLVADYAVTAPHQAGHDGMGGDPRQPWTAAQPRRRAAAGRPRHRLHRPPVVLARCVDHPDDGPQRLRGSHGDPVRAVVYDRYGPPDVLRVADVEMPVPAAHEVLVEVVATSVNLSDWECLRGSPLYARIGGLRRPARAVLGSDIAGRVRAVGRDVAGLRPGDEVYGDNLSLKGGFAEYAVAPASALAPKPPGLTFAEACAIPQSGVIALQATAGAGPGRRVLINGAGGGSGSFAIQLARRAGAHVTGVDAEHKLDFMTSLGADEVLDHRRQDFTRPGEPYDLVLDLVAGRSVFAYRRALAPGGRYSCVGGSVSALLRVLTIGSVVGLLSRRRLRVLAVKQGPEHFGPLADLCVAGHVAIHVDRTFGLDEVPDALGYVGGGRSLGKVVIEVARKR